MSLIGFYGSRTGPKAESGFGGLLVKFGAQDVVCVVIQLGSRVWVGRYWRLSLRLGVGDSWLEVSVALGLGRCLGFGG